MDTSQLQRTDMLLFDTRTVYVATPSGCWPYQTLRWLSSGFPAFLERVRREGKRLGRPVAKADAAIIRRMRDEGKSWGDIARKTGLSRRTCQKVYGKEGNALA